MMDWKELAPLVKLAIQEDVGEQDITTKLCLPTKLPVSARIIAKEAGILAGLGLAKLVFSLIDPEIEFIEQSLDGKEIEPDEIVALIKGNAQGILSGERTALNLLQRLCGIATMTSRFVQLVKPYPVQIFDTRKTTPLWRKAEKYAVKMGGGQNHRFGLFDGILIKDNHLKLCAGITPAVKAAQKSGMKIEVETKDLDEVKEAASLEVNIIMLDNMPLNLIQEAVKIIRASSKGILIEVSGGVNLGNVHQIASTGVDIISIGALTHSPKALDLSLEVD